MHVGVVYGVVRHHDNPWIVWLSTAAFLLTCCPPVCLSACPTCSYFPRPGLDHTRRLLRLALQTLSPHYCLARGMQQVGGRPRVLG